MTKEEFAGRVLEIKDTLYRLSATLLKRECDREDAVSEAVARGLARLGSLRREEAFEAWMARILINACYTQLRRSSREIPVEALPEVLAAPEASANLYSLFWGVDEKYRLPMVLYYVEGYEVAQVSRILRRPVGTVKSQLMRGRKLLKDHLALEEVLS